jgi:TonB family protein
MRIRSVCGLALVVLSAAVALGQSAPLVTAANLPSGNSTLNTAASQGPFVPLGLPIQWDVPKYPKQALRNRTEGDVVLSLNVDPKGKIKNVSVVSGNPKLAESAAKAARKWKYAPCMRNGRAIAVTTRSTLHFKITDDGLPKITATHLYPHLAVGSVIRVGVGVNAPKGIFLPSPEYTQEARNAKYDGICVLGLIVDSDGNTRDIQVLRSLAMGLDAKVIDAVKRWKFLPVIKHGKPVEVPIQVEIQFRLY